ncbi:MAG: GuaB3 family IMP dehydrogenase-related protein [Frankiaceae bacterium]|nr:GuaB3 family IMP dehydrogenase-related protein [Frankiaceae bacterium]MBV9869082.1 GuaB3 family IMP dehydrogenase-related protein [Frankiaceae bacterium]
MSRDSVEIGLGRSARRGFTLGEIAIVPSRRTRDVDMVSLTWQIDAYRFDIPLVGFPSDATMSPETVGLVGKAGGLGVLDAEGLWTRYDDPLPLLARLSELDPDSATRELQRIYAEPVRDELISQRIKELRDTGAVTAVRVSPQHTLRHAPTILSAGVDMLVIQGTIVSAEHVSGSAAQPPLNLKTFIADLDVPVIVGGCTNYQTALHLMRTGAAGVVVGVGADEWSTTANVLGIEVPMATAIVDAAAARRDYLDETGGRYVHVIAAGEMETSGDIAKAVACGADAVMLGEPLSMAAEAPGRGAWWHVSASHPMLPRGRYAEANVAWPLGSLDEVLSGPSTSPEGFTNLFGGVKRAIAKAGYSDLKEFQRVELVVR